MRKVVIGIDELGHPYVVSAPKKVEVVFKYPKKQTFKKRVKTLVYRIKAGLL